MGSRALILGITGQDGSYLAEVLLEKGYEVHGMVRRSATGNTRNIRHIEKDLVLHRGDLADVTSLYRIIRAVRPEEIFNEADQDHVGWSFEVPAYSYDITGAAVGRVLEVVHQVDPSAKFFQPCSSNIFGRAVETPQTEQTPFRPQSPYACAKILAYVVAQHYREAYGMFVATGIFYNHESPRRPEEYVTRKVTAAVARIKKGLQQTLSLGDLSAQIDWGYAREYMEAAWKIMQQPRPDDYVISTGETHSVKEWVDTAFDLAALRAEDHVRIDPTLLRPSSTTVLVGDASKASAAFGFRPKVKFAELIKIMLEEDLRVAGHRS